MNCKQLPYFFPLFCHSISLRWLQLIESHSLCKAHLAISWTDVAGLLSQVGWLSNKTGLGNHLRKLHIYSNETEKKTHKFHSRVLIPKGLFCQACKEMKNNEIINNCCYLLSWQECGSETELFCRTWIPVLNFIICFTSSLSPLRDLNKSCMNECRKGES